jgi:hypothetical protein
MKKDGLMSKGKGIDLDQGLESQVYGGREVGMLTYLKDRLILVWKHTKGLGMRIYYLDRKLTDEEAKFVEEALKLTEPIEQVRIPHILPASDPDGGHRARPLLDDELLSGHLKKAGIMRDYGRQVCLVISQDMHWYGALSHAIFNTTGFYPYLVQTKDHRERISNPGEIRITDMHGMMTR